MPRPFLRWAGGKFKLLAHIAPYFTGSSVLAEPFAGAASLSLNVEKDLYLLNDINPDLMACYSALKEHRSEFILFVRKYFSEVNNTEERYLELRQLFRETNDLTEKAALFIYLNRHGYNGLCRYSRNGFNVPFGRVKKPYFPKAEMGRFIEIADRVEIYSLPFSDFFSELSSQNWGGDLGVYADPPYFPVNDVGFTAYSGRTFTDVDQALLACYARKLARDGSTVVISNHDVDAARVLYSDARTKTISVSRNISCRKDGRKAVSEIIAEYPGRKFTDTKKTA